MIFYFVNSCMETFGTEMMQFTTFDKISHFKILYLAAENCLDTTVS